MESVIVIVGFLGAGKTTLLRHLVSETLEAGGQPFVILNDYENATMDAQPMMEWMDRKWIRPLSGSCICCSGIVELRETVNRIPRREQGMTLIEANGTTDACSLMGFLGVGLEDHFLPPVQVSVLDVKNWQTRGEHNELEANQIQVSSLIVLTHLDEVTTERKTEVVQQAQAMNPQARILTVDELRISLLSGLSPSANTPDALEHDKAHWASCSVDLPPLPSEACIQALAGALPASLLRVKGCTRVGGQAGYTYFERTPDGSVSIRAYNGEPLTGPKLLTVGPGSDPDALRSLIPETIAAYMSSTTS